jgi:hypothetical protein
MSTVNPYAPPMARVDDISEVSSEAEAIRREHIKHEASVRSIGILYYIGGFGMIAGAIAFLAIGLSGSSSEAIAAAPISAFVVIYGGLGVLSVLVARGIRQFASWARATATVLSVIGLIGIPVGTIINGYILWLLHSAKGRRIFAPDYPSIVAATPSVKYRTSIIAWIVLGLLLLAFAGALFVAMIGR